MNRNTLKHLAIAAVLLVVALLVVENTGNHDTVAGGDLLFADLKSKINEVTSISVSGSDGGGDLTTVARDADGWAVRERDDYAASVGKIREVLLGIADAKILETKTSNPERYPVLGIADPGVEGGGTLVVIAGDGIEYRLIIGNTAQSDNRYVRIADQPQGLLIDHDPDLPESSGGWLLQEIVDVPANTVRAVEITHPDGESIRISKESAEDTKFAVADIPEGRELSYPTVANGMGGVLAALALQDVRKNQAPEDFVRTVFETFDDLRIVVRSVTEETDTWIDVAAEPAEDERAGLINDRVGGWQYKVESYKANLLMRRWDDILKEPPTAEE